ncbi:GNAT family N-acetyltransferase [Rhodococcus aerolatus]
MTVPTTRLLTDDDTDAAFHLARLAFGGTEATPPAGYSGARPGRLTWGTVVDGRLVAKAVDREQHQLFGGRSVPTAGIAGVVVAPELRRTGVGRALLTHLLGAAKDRGAVISTLFRTTPEPYRRLGFEQVGVLRWTAVATAALAGLRTPAGTTLRAATAADVPRLREVRAEVARGGTGAMDPAGPLFDRTPEAELAAHDGTTLAVDAAGVVQGFTTWDRGPGYDAAAVLTVPDVLALTADATTALLASLGSWAQVAPTLHLRLPDPDPALLLGALTHTRVLSEDPWMLRVLDAPGAVAARGWPAPVGGMVDLELDDDVLPANAGRWRLHLDGGTAVLERGGTGAVRLAPRGLSAWYAGTSPAVLRRAGLLTGGSAADDALLAAATAGPPASLLDYF